VLWTQAVDGSSGEVKMSEWQTWIILFKSCFGVGILGIPFAFRNAGVIPGLLSVIVIAMVTNIATKLLVWTKRNIHAGNPAIPVTSIPEMALATFGVRGQRAANVVILTCQLGTITAYNIFIGEFLTAGAAMLLCAAAESESR